jgi:hypothetical protein
MTELQKLIGLKSSKKAVFAVAMIGLILGALVICVLGVQQEYIKPPTPTETPTGYAVLSAYDPINENYLSGEILLIFHENNTLWLETSTNVTFYMPAPSYALIICGPDYYNETISLKGSGGNDSSTPYDNTAYIFKKAPNSDVILKITQLDGIYGDYSASDIPDGRHSVTLTISIIGASRGTAVFGHTCYIPDTLINKTYATLYGEFGPGGWIGWNGSIQNLKYWDREEPVYLIGDEVNATCSWGVEYDLSIAIEADFYNLDSVMLYYGFLDDWQNYFQKV